MTLVCDLCEPRAGDHDKPYRFARHDELELRFTDEEMIRLERLRSWVLYERNGGHKAGPAWHDIEPDGAAGGG